LRDPQRKQNRCFVVDHQNPSFYRKTVIHPLQPPSWSTGGRTFGRLKRDSQVWKLETSFRNRARGGRISLQPNGLSGSPAVVSPIHPSHFRFYGCSIRRQEKERIPSPCLDDAPTLQRLSLLQS